MFQMAAMNHGCTQNQQQLLHSLAADQNYLLYLYFDASLYPIIISGYIQELVLFFPFFLA